MTKQPAPSRTKRWTIQSLLAVSVLGLGTAGVMTYIDQGNPVEAAQAEAEPEAISLLTYSHVEQLRRSGGLSNEDLAALDMDETEAAAVLTRLADWCKVNEEALSDSQRSVARAQNEVRENQRLTRTGQATQTELADGNKKIKALYEATKAQQELSETGTAYAMQAAPGKSAAWARANELKGRTSLEMRYLAGLDKNRLDSLNAESKRRGVTLEKALSRSELRELARVRDRIRIKMAGVQAAEVVALPMPRELRLVEEGLHSPGLLVEE